MDPPEHTAVRKRSNAEADLVAETFGSHVIAATGRRLNEEAVRTKVGQNAKNEAPEPCELMDWSTASIA